MFTRLRDDEAGAALVVAIAFAAIISVYAVMVFATMHASQQGSRTVRNVTSARAAADAGAESVIFQLGVSGEVDAPWDTYVSTYDDPLVAKDAGASHPKLQTKDLGQGRYYVTVTAHPSDPRLRYVNAVGEYPKGSGDLTRLKVTVKREAPQAFNYAMFADNAITIHHHGTILSPLITTPKVHSNGDATLPASSEMNVEELTVVGSLEMDSGTGGMGSHANMSAGDTGGSSTVDGYSWRYNIGPHNRCYPTWNPYQEDDPANFGNVSEPQTPYASHAGNGCDRRMFSGVAGVVGDVLANSADVGGAVKSAGERMTEAGVPMEAKAGNVFVSNEGGAKIGGETVNGAPGEVKSCGNCNNSSGQPGKIAGQVHITDEGPQPVQFPSIDYENTYKPRALRQQSNSCLPDEPCDELDGGKQHIFSGSDDWLDYITDPDNGFYRRIRPSGVHELYKKNNGNEPDYILLRGDWYVYGGVKLASGDVNEAVADEIPNFDDEAEPSIPIVIAGTLVSPDGGMDMKGRLYLVGRGNHTEFLEEDPNSDIGDVRVNMCTFLNKADPAAGSSVCGADLGPQDGFPGVEPGVLAGTSQNGSDGDTDSKWEDDGDYEPTKTNATWVRGLVYAGEWDDDDQQSEAGDHHWHNQDPKNSVRIFGSQVGGKLHDCNNFEFTYDDVVLNAFGFASGDGSVKIVAWDEV